MTVPVSSVTMTLSADTYVEAKTVKLKFNVVFAMTDENLDAKAEVLKAANQIDDSAKWYIIDASSSNDNSGIPSATFTLSVRVGEKIVNSISSRISKVNRPGLQFKVIETDYKPEAQQIKDAQKELRKQIYKQAVEEVAILNDILGKASSEDGWVIGSISYNERAPNVNLYNNTRAAASKSIAFSESFGGDDEEAGITQRVELTAQFEAVRKIYDKL